MLREKLEAALQEAQDQGHGNIIDLLLQALALLPEDNAGKM